MTLPQYQLLPQGEVVHDEPYDLDFSGPLHVDLNQQYHLVALARPATNTGDDPEVEDDVADEEEEEEVEGEKNHIAGRANSLLVLLCLILPLLLSSQFCMTFLVLHNHESESTADLSGTIVMLIMLLFVLTINVLLDSVGGTMGGLRNVRSNMMIVLLQVPKIILDVRLLLIREKIEPSLATLLAGSLVISTCIVITSARHLYITCIKGDIPMNNRRRFGSLVLF